MFFVVALLFKQTLLLIEWYRIRRCQDSTESNISQTKNTSHNSKIEDVIGNFLISKLPTFLIN